MPSGILQKIPDIQKTVKKRITHFLTVFFSGRTCPLCISFKLSF